MDKYKNKEFSELFLPVHNVAATRDLLKEYPILETYPEFHQELDGLDRNHVIRYIIYAFDQNTPLPDDILQRRIEAVQLAGFQKRSGKYRKEIEQMVRGESVVVNQMVIAYCSIQASDIWMAYISYQEAYRQELISLQTGEGDKTKDVISNTEKLREVMKKTRRELLSTDRDDSLNRDLYRYVESARLKIRPEDYAKRLGISIKKDE